jgi:hypothetical protein
VIIGAVMLEYCRVAINNAMRILARDSQQPLYMEHLVPVISTCSLGQLVASLAILDIHSSVLNENARAAL